MPDFRGLGCPPVPPASSHHVLCLVSYVMTSPIYIFLLDRYSQHVEKKNYVYLVIGQNYGLISLESSRN